MTVDISQHLLGETREILEVGTSEEVRRVTTALISQARYGVDIVTRDLDAAVYDDAELLERLKGFVLDRRRVKVRILLRDPGPALRAGHRLIPLARQLSSFFEIRVPAVQHRDFNQAFIVVDRAGYVHRELAERFDGTASFHDPMGAEALRRQFEEMWEPASASPDLRRLHL